MTPLNANLADGTRLEVRVGIHTGPVVIADGGEVFGETANLAARVQTAAELDTGDLKDAKVLLDELAR